MKAIWNGQLLAESVETIVIEGNHYFPPKDVNLDFFNNSDYHTTCHIKGKAFYYTITVNGQMNIDAAWFYPSPKEPAKEIKNHIAFWKGVEVSL
ncbi:MAG: DUF427 domain-containing protein [Salinivirgaceae bacterium]|nr:DUF427 domain-containing protein [Salinivirgaceae bacterium]